jgi:hypothetical protein
MPHVKMHLTVTAKINKIALLESFSSKKIRYTMENAITILSEEQKQKII